MGEKGRREKKGEKKDPAAEDEKPFSHKSVYYQREPIRSACWEGRTEGIGLQKGFAWRMRERRRKGRGLSTT